MRRFAIASVIALVAAGSAAADPFLVRFDTLGLGSFTVELHDDTPLHRDNFLQYVTDGAFTDSIVHRSDYSVDVIQGGGFYFANPGSIDYIPTPYAPVDLEANLGGSNLLGTLGAARTTDPDSHTCGWYLNMADNSGIFDSDPGMGTDGYTVFGHVTEGWEVAEAIYALTVWDASPLLGSGFAQLPLHDTFTSPSDKLMMEHLVIVTGATVIPVIPEPATLALLAAGALALVRRRRR